MCGIFFSTSDLIKKRNLDGFTQKVCELIKHRGIYPPNIYHDDNFVFAHTLMPVQGVSPVHQPMIDEDRTLIFAGELWQHDGEASDTEFLFKALCESDDIAKTLRALRGMFAIVFKDKDTIYFASDVFGEAPLYFWHNRSSVCVGSEIKQLVGIGVPMKEVKAALPGVLYIFQNEKLSTVSYHSWSFTNNALEFDAKHLRGLVRKSVQEHYTTINLQQRAILLSGGLDSTIIAYELARLGLKEAYTVGTHPDCMDFKTARRTANLLGLSHNTVVVEELDIDCALTVTEVSNRSVVEESCCLIGLSNALAANNVRVVFSGTGADEIFVGYQHLLRFVTKENRNTLQRHFIEKHHTLDLRASNKTYMLNAVEVRNPFLSVDLMNYVATFDVDKLLIGPKRQMKFALRRAYEPVIGELANNPKLIAFETMGIKNYFRSHNGDSPLVYRKRFKEIFSDPLQLPSLVARAKTIR